MSRQKQPTTPPGADVDAFAIDIALRLLPVCSTLAALCLAGLAYLEAVAPEAVKDTLADEVLFVAGFLFLTNIYLIIWTMRRGPTPRARKAARAASILFVVAMTLMIADGGYFFFVLNRNEWTARPSARVEPKATVTPTDKHLVHASRVISGSILRVNR
jgi:cytochrome bd-type quinol oxidase subunit 1